MRHKDIPGVLRMIWLFISKHAMQQSTMRQIVPGSYSREVRNGDTRHFTRVIIEQISELAELFKVHKLALDEQTQGDQTITNRKAEEWFAAYDTSTRTLVEISGDRHCIFIPEGLLMLMDNHAYVKSELGQITASVEKVRERFTI
ncbi:hypothetical protein [Mucilaginibacter paludis]|uniref:hypothetical protein n=1 Tax=Mucilaginibacter paludis TaxID=423351 RepID=UPI0001E9DBCF|nr:hypothetical protein [Mucilaginibacter paludis]